MMDDYPEIDEAMMTSLIRDYERKENIPPLEEPPLPPSDFIEDSFMVDSLHDVGAVEKINSPKEMKDLPSFPVELRTKEPIAQEEKKENDDVRDLDLIENVFDKRVSEEQLQQQMFEEQNKNDSGRLLDKKDVEVKTELNDAEILTITKLRFMADRYNVPVLREFTNNLMLLKISRNRKGRREFIEGLHADEKREQPSEGLMSRMFGGRQ